MNKEILEKLNGKFVKIISSNSIFNGQIISLGEDYVKIINKFGNQEYIVIEHITSVEET